MVQRTTDFLLSGYFLEKHFMAPLINFGWIKFLYKNMRRTAKYKPYALCRIHRYLSLDKAKLQANAFINSQFYKGLVYFCMFVRKILVSKLHRIHYRKLQVVFNTYKSYSDLLRLNNIPIHQAHWLTKRYWIRRDTPYLFVFSPNAGKYGPE